MADMQLVDALDNRRPNMFRNLWLREGIWEVPDGGLKFTNTNQTALSVGPGFQAESACFPGDAGDIQQV